LILIFEVAQHDEFMSYANKVENFSNMAA